MDPTNPDHYKVGGLQPYEYMKMKMTPEQYEGFLLGNIIKYVSRYPHKNGLEDLQKAYWYLESLIQEAIIRENPNMKIEGCMCPRCTAKKKGPSLDLSSPQIKTSTNASLREDFHQPRTYNCSDCEHCDMPIDSNGTDPCRTCNWSPDATVQPSNWKEKTLR